MTTTPHGWRLVQCTVAAATISACTQTSAATRGLSEADRRAIRANDSVYVSAWLRDDTAAVFSTLEPEPVLLPGGLTPLQGRAAIKAFWWPTDGSHTSITAFDRTIDEIDGAGSVGFVRGTDSLRFTSTKNGSRQEAGCARSRSRSSAANRTEAGRSRAWHGRR